VAIVDDDAQILAVVGRMLSREGFECHPLQTTSEARAWLRANDCDVLLCDVNMPGESGLELVESVLLGETRPAVLMMSGDDDPAIGHHTLELGAYGYLVKPFRAMELLLGVQNALSRRSLEIQNRRQQEFLEERINQRTRDLQRVMVGLRDAQGETIDRLARAVEFRDPETGGHIARMSQLCHLVAVRVGSQAGEILIASPLHDVGKIGVPDHILLKPGPLTAAERVLMERHAATGHQLLVDSSSELLRLAATIAWTHHERYDGTGYPRGLSGEEIPLVGRIAAVADVFDALTSHRVYRPAFPFEVALEMVKAERGRHFDPFVLDALLSSLDDFRRIRSEESAQPAEQTQPW
jgi:putative two-component system response regulator